ncbi:MAG TPA: hypothetical protein PLI97_04360 [Fluviicola sp.]|nr:hypothetical protein [Fluviicola sp.]
MKNLVLLLGLLFTVQLSAIAQISHDLEIYSENGEKFYLTINGRKMNDVAVSQIQITNTDKDYVSAKIEFENIALPAIEKKFLQIAEPGDQVKVPVSTAYKIVEKKGELKLNFASRSQKKIQQNSEVIIIQNPQPVNGRIVISW